MITPDGVRRCRGRSTPALVPVAVAVALACLSIAAPTPVAAQTTLRIAAYNVRHGLGMDGTLDLERIANVLRPLAADVITLQEIDRGVERTNGVDQAQRLGALLGMSAHFGDFMPYQGGEYGMAVLSRLPVLGVMNHRLPDGDEPRTALEVTVQAGREGVPAPPRGVSDRELRASRFRASGDRAARLNREVPSPRSGQPDLSAV